LNALSKSLTANLVLAEVNSLLNPMTLTIGTVSASGLTVPITLSRWNLRTETAGLAFQVNGVARTATITPVLSTKLNGEPSTGVGAYKNFIATLATPVIPTDTVTYTFNPAAMSAFRNAPTGSTDQPAAVASPASVTNGAAYPEAGIFPSNYLSSFTTDWMTGFLS